MVLYWSLQVRYYGISIGHGMAITFPTILINLITQATIQCSDRADFNWSRVRETFELNQLKLFRFSQDLTGCKLLAIDLDRSISYIFFQVSANFFFIVMTTSLEIGCWQAGLPL
jgi:hypothetical protein